MASDPTAEVATRRIERAGRNARPAAWCYLIAEYDVGARIEFVKCVISGPFFSVSARWLSQRAETEKNGPLITHFTNSILAPTSYSAIK